DPRRGDKTDSEDPEATSAAVAAAAVVVGSVRPRHGVHAKARVWECSRGRGGGAEYSRCRGRGAR
uniref:Uncharacterized protein n=1 Tax=Aegilops tauschii subsp. strangulata TaxID=200361 RepID=A0A453E4F8_AEGTS